MQELASGHHAKGAARSRTQACSGARSPAFIATVRTRAKRLGTGSCRQEGTRVCGHDGLLYSSFGGNRVLCAVTWLHSAGKVPVKRKQVVE